MNNDLEKELEALEDFDFKPITEGLGFHHSIAEKSKIKTELKSQQKSLRKDLEKRSQLLKVSHNDQRPHVEHMGELAAFYENPTIDTSNIAPLIKTEERPDVVDVSMFTRFSAWIVDLLVISFMFATSIISIFALADMPYDLLNPVMISKDIVTSFGTLFLMFYIFYFSFLDKTEYSTLGKRLFNIKLIGMTKRPSLFKTFNRTLLSLLSVFTLGLLTLLSLQDSLTDTKVVKRQNV